MTPTHLLCHLRIPKNHIQVQKEKENLAVACLRPPSNVKLGIFSS